MKSNEISVDEAKKLAEDIRLKTLKLKESLEKKKKKKKKKQKRDRQNEAPTHEPVTAKRDAEVPQPKKRALKPLIPLVETGKVNPYLAHARMDDEGFDDSTDNVNYDSRLRPVSKDMSFRGRKALKFIPQGKYIKQAAVERAQHAHKEFLKNRGDEKTRDKFKELLDGVSSVDNNDLAAQKLVMKQSTVPRIEWWDAAFLPKKRKREESEYGYDDLKIENEKSFKLVEHPASVLPVVLESDARAIPLYLTKDERKRQRRKVRRERAQLIQDKIAAGLIPAPPPKVKLSNLMRVLGDEAVADPSLLEKKVAQQVKERVENHEMRGLAEKLTPQERYEKKVKTAAEENKAPPVVALYQVNNISDPPDLAAANRYKMDANAQKLFLTGCVLIVRDPVELENGDKKQCNLVIVEGPEKKLRKFEHQMLKRIKWPDSSEVGKPSCVKVWQGRVPKKMFPKKLFFRDFDTGTEARQYLEGMNIQHYWDMALAF